jgi:diacylglycerol O-acyltransferase
VRQLTGLDASFLYLETANSPMHIGGFTIYDPSTAPGGKVRFKQIVEHMHRRARRVPAMTSRLKTVPFSLDHPYWVADGDFDPEFHVRHIALPKPGDWRQLCILISRIHARPLDRSRPLWEAYVIEGLDDVAGFPKGCFALYTKMHHAAIDGASGVEINSVLHDLSADFATNVDTEAEPFVEQSPKKTDMLWQAQKNTLKLPFRFVGLTKDAAPSLYQAAKGIISGKLKRVSGIPRTRFNRNVSPHRVVDALRVSFEDIRSIKAAYAPVTINDVALTIVGGALRQYLLAKNELPESSLAALAPINIRTADKQGAAGNEVSQMTVQLRTDIADPRERLLAVNESTRNAKELTNAIGAKTMTDYLQFTPSTLTASAARLSSSLSLANRISPFYNCVVTNVPGPRIPLYFCGAKMLVSFPTGPAIDSVGLFQAISSYCDEFTITFTACREMLPDPEMYAQCLRDSLATLLDAARQEAKQTPKLNKSSAPRKAKSAASKGIQKGTQNDSQQGLTEQQ